MPFQLERRGQSVHTFIQQLHHAIVTAIDVDFANPDRARRFNLYRSVGCSNPGPAHPSETFPHAFENPRPIVAPLILIIVANKIGRSFPVSVVERMKEIFCVQPNLMLRSPKPEQIQADAQCSGQYADDCSTKRNCHKRALIFPETPANGRLNGYGFLKDGSTGSFTDWSRSQPSFSSLMCSIAIAFALASRSGRISYSETQQR
jgi:hypothetical protein